MNNDFCVTGIFKIILVDKNEYPQDTLHFNPSLYHNELILHLSGSGTCVFGGETLQTSPGTVRFLPKGNASEYTVYKKESGDCIDVFFDTDVPVSDKAFTVDSGSNKTIAALFKKIFSVWVAKDSAYCFESVSLLYKILAEMQKTNYIPESRYALISPAVKYIEENYYKMDITSKILSDLCGISYSYLKRLFIEKFGLPPIKYTIQLRINYACDLLKESSIPISSVARMCGFSDVYFFSRQFKSYMGMTPSEFKRKYISCK